jgi:N utilization substance protein B
MKRNAAREIAIQLGFAVSANGQEPECAVQEFFEPEHYATMADEGELYGEKPSKKDIAFITQSVAGVTEKKAELDDYIGRYAKGWRMERISKSAAAVLRQAMYEILYMPDVPDAAAIDEAIELAKGYEDGDVVSFINGVLGGFYRGEVEKSVQPELSGDEEQASEEEPVEQSEEMSAPEESGEPDHE